MTSSNTVAAKRGKKYADKAQLIKKDSYPIAEAAELIGKLSTSSFDGSVEAHIRINADTTQADQLVRTTVVLPHGTGKSVNIAAFVPDDLVEAAKKAGASKAGNDDLIAEIEAGTIDIDVAVAVPEVMKQLGKVAKTLGQKGLMPNPKAGTVTPDIEKAIDELSKGRIECKMDKTGIIHTVIGKTSFSAKQLQENYEALLSAIKEAQPSGIKGNYIFSITLAPSMGPGLTVQQ